MVNYIQRLHNVITDEEFNIRIRREDILEDALIAVNRTAFSPYKTIVVCVLFQFVAICAT